MPKIISAQIIDIGRFKALYFSSVPPRIEAAVVFDGQTLSQKLVFKLMDISWRHGFGCSAPQFEDKGDLVFSVGTTLPSGRSLRRYTAKLNKCLEELADFSADFERQLDFTTLDISMFEGLNPNNLDLSLIAALRDQQYNGSWEALQNAMIENERPDEALVVACCREFEKVNNKDIGLICNKLLDTLEMVSSSEGFSQN